MKKYRVIYDEVMTITREVIVETESREDVADMVRSKHPSGYSILQVQDRELTNFRIKRVHEPKEKTS